MVTMNKFLRAGMREALIQMKPNHIEDIIAFIGKKTEGEILEFQEVGKEPKKISLKEIIKILKEQKVKN